MDFGAIGSQVVDVIRAGCSWQGFKWRRASDTKEDPDCAIFHMDIDVKPGTMQSLSVILWFLRFFSKPENRPDVAHSFFDHLNQQSQKGVDAKVRIVVRLEPRPAEPEAELIHTSEAAHEDSDSEDGESFVTLTREQEERWLREHGYGKEKPGMRWLRDHGYTGKEKSVFDEPLQPLRRKGVSDTHNLSDMTNEERSEWNRRHGLGEL